eukprot:6479333-Amphidinium_carterae.2
MPLTNTPAGAESLRDVFTLFCRATSTPFQTKSSKPPHPKVPNGLKTVLDYSLPRGPPLSTPNESRARDFDTTLVPLGPQYFVHNFWCALGRMGLQHDSGRMVRSHDHPSILLLFCKSRCSNERSGSRRTLPPPIRVVQQWGLRASVLAAM